MENIIKSIENQINKIHAMKMELEDLEGGYYNQLVKAQNLKDSMEGKTHEAHQA